MRAVDLGCAIPEKQRFLVGAQKVMKLDLVDPIALDATRQDQLVAMAAGALSVWAGVEAWRQRRWSKVVVGAAAFLMAPLFPIGTVLAAVGFLALGRQWRRTAPAPVPGSER